MHHTSPICTIRQPHGRAWKILNKDLLFSSVIPKYYVCKKYDSFTRQLNGWGFKRLYQSGPDLGCFYHECFLRSLPKLTCLIRRLKSNQGKTTPYPAGEPNFYLISETYPLPDSEPLDASARCPEAAEEGASTALALDTPARGNEAPSHSMSPNQIQFPSLPQIHPSTLGPSAVQESAAFAQIPHQGLSQEPMAMLAAAAHEHSTEGQHPSFSSTTRPSSHEYSVGYAAGLAAAARRPNGPSHPMPHYTPDFHYQPQPSDHKSYSYPRSYSTNYPPPKVGNSGQPPRYQYPPFEPPRFRYPRPELPRYQYPPPPNYHYPYANPIHEFMQLLGYQHSQESNFKPEPAVLPPSEIQVIHDGNAKSPYQPSEKRPRGSPVIEPLPNYSPRLDKEIRESDSSAPKRKDPPGSDVNLNSDSPLHKKRRGEDPPWK